MMPGVFFQIANTVAMLGWLALIIGAAFKRQALRDTVAGLFIPLLLSAAHAALIAVFWWSADGGFGSLNDVQKLFASGWIALAGWLHYLAFDLAIGALVSRQIMERGVSRLVLIPILPLTFQFGPIGYLLAQMVLLSHPQKTGV